MGIEPNDARRKRIEFIVRSALSMGSVLAGVLSGAGISSAEPSASPPASALAGALGRAAPAADPRVLELAARALACRKQASVRDDRILGVIDYSRPSTSPRLWIFDVLQQKLLYEERVAHGRNSGGDLAERFSNEAGSLESSLGGFEGAGTYFGHNGYSLRLRGLEPGFNDRAMERAIVVHGAPYVSEELVQRQGRLGRSFGCPAVRTAIARPLIDTLSEGSFLFAYYPDADWLGRSRLLGDCAGPTHGIAQAVEAVDPVQAKRSPVAH